MNFKKQLWPHGRSVMPKEEAVKYCNTIVDLIKKKRDEMICGADVPLLGARAFLDELEYKMIKEKLRREIIEDNE